MVRAYHAHATGQMLTLDRRYGLLVAIGLFEIVATTGLAIVGFHLDYLVGVVTGALVARPDAGAVSPSPSASAASASRPPTRRGSPSPRW